MAIVENLYTGNGSTTLYSFTFPYLNESDVKVTLNGSPTTAYVFASATSLQFLSAPGAGVAIRIYRETDDTELAATFFPGSSIRAADLNNDFDQLLYLGQESSSIAGKATVTANTALANSNTAISTANAAVSSANTAVSTANAAVVTANNADANASAAVSTANAASATAAGAVSSANSAVSTANSAVSTANGAVSTANAATSTANQAAIDAAAAVVTANAADGKADAAVITANSADGKADTAIITANTADSNASSAVSTANNALSVANNAEATALVASADATNAIAAVSAAALYVIIADVAAIPGSPSNGDGVQIVDSTGIELFTPLSGVPVGFIGDPGLFVRLRYDGGLSTWVWVEYQANDPETRYGDAIGLAQADATQALSDAAAAQGDASQALLDAAAAQNTADVALPKAGGTMTGAINMGTNQINSVTDPTSAQDAATKNYVDNEIAGINSVSQNNSSISIVDDNVNPAEAVVTLDGNTAINVQAAGTNSYTPIFQHEEFTVTNQKAISFMESALNGVNVVGFQAPASITSDVLWTLPATDAAVSGYALKSDGAGNLSWGLAGGALGGGTDQVFYENDQTVTTNYTLGTNKNAVTAGPITINSGVTVTVPANQSWVIV